ncbi:hypothetical protein SLEP1_g14606 [Rubroshorea leprosula]|uniref:DNA polymerase delta subunit 3 n=1 Tax=Rubroshorea leprosula TaxID=152421 RepID=A0AAV5IQH7_9ROSI|nr:hypothetical protein SLEP1_g14606 [Rubroshorea leprosula]
MADIETLGILEEIQALVSDKLQVVSYKWLSRNFLVSSNVAKRLLAEFVEKHGSELEIVYTLSGWLKCNPPSYHIKLVTGPKLAEAEQEFDGNCSVQVYSVQACIPKDPAALWNAEFVQAEELFKQHSNIDNCLRDNRFCGISNSFVKRNVDGTPVSIAAAQPKTVGTSGPSKNSSAQSNVVSSFQKNKIEPSSSKFALQSPSPVEDVRSDDIGGALQDKATNSSADKEKIRHLPSTKKKGQSDKSSSGGAGLLANLLDRASAKSKSTCAPAADPPICVHEAAEEGGMDDDAYDVNFKGVSNGEGNRKRKVVLDFSDEDEYEDAINLASPDPPKELENAKILASEKANLIVDKPKENEPNVKEERTTNGEPNKLLGKETSVAGKSTNGEKCSPTKNENQLSESGMNKKDKVTGAVPNSPKRKKVMKTRIDERGREVTEVVWEGGVAEVKKVESEITSKADSNAVTNTINRPPAAKKSSAVGSTAPNPGSKAGNKKAGKAKDPKQGNILSFFKKV